MNKYFLAVAIVFSSQTSFAVNPSEVLISLYAVAVSTSADCSDPIIVLNNGDTAVEYNFSSTPNLGSASVSDGTYPCMILKMSDVIKFKPAATTGSCTSGTQYTIDVCRSGQGSYTPLSISGTSGGYGSTTNCTGSLASPTDDKVTLFLSTQSTNSTGSGGNAFLRPASAGTNGFYLDGSFTVSGTKSGTFVVNFNDKIDGSNSDCDLQPPLFGFR